MTSMSGMGWLLTLGTLFVAGCAIMAAFGFKGRVTTIGVDLGTTFSVVGISNKGVVSIVSDEQGHKIFPSIVSFLDGGKVIAGYEALARVGVDPANTIYNAKVHTRIHTYTYIRCVHMYMCLCVCVV